MYFFGSRTFVSISWMCKKQTSVSLSSTDSEIIPLDAGLRMNGLLALDIWNVVIECYVHRTVPNHQPIPQQENVRAITNPTPNKRETDRDVC